MHFKYIYNKIELYILHILHILRSEMAEDDVLFDLEGLDLDVAQEYEEVQEQEQEYEQELLEKLKQFEMNEFEYTWYYGCKKELDILVKLIALPFFASWEFFPDDAGGISQSIDFQHENDLIRENIATELSIREDINLIKCICKRFSYVVRIYNKTCSDLHLQLPESINVKCEEIVNIARIVKYMVDTIINSKLNDKMLICKHLLDVATIEAYMEIRAKPLFEQLKIEFNAFIASIVDNINDTTVKIYDVYLSNVMDDMQRIKRLRKMEAERSEYYHAQKVVSDFNGFKNQKIDKQELSNICVFRFHSLRKLALYETIESTIQEKIVELTQKLQDAQQKQKELTEYKAGASVKPVALHK